MKRNFYVSCYILLCMTYMCNLLVMVFFYEEINICNVSQEL